MTELNAGTPFLVMLVLCIAIQFQTVKNWLYDLKTGLKKYKIVTNLKLINKNSRNFEAESSIVY